MCCGSFLGYANKGRISSKLESEERQQSRFRTGFLEYFVSFSHQILGSE